MVVVFIALLRLALEFGGSGSGLHCCVRASVRIWW